MGVSKHNYLTVSVHFSLENHFPMIKHRYRKAHYKIYSYCNRYNLVDYSRSPSLCSPFSFISHLGILPFHLIRLPSFPYNRVLRSMGPTAVELDTPQECTWVMWFSVFLWPLRFLQM